MTTQTDIQIKEIRTSADLNRFLKFPWKIYRKDSNWVPLLLSEQRESLGPDSLFREHGKFLLLVAERDGRNDRPRSRRTDEYIRTNG